MGVASQNHWGRGGHRVFLPNDLSITEWILALKTAAEAVEWGVPDISQMTMYHYEIGGSGRYIPTP